LDDVPVPAPAVFREQEHCCKEENHLESSDAGEEPVHCEADWPLLGHCSSDCVSNVVEGDESDSFPWSFAKDDVLLIQNNTWEDDESLQKNKHQANKLRLGLAAFLADIPEVLTDRFLHLN
jgi:hypothetical protein